jgi:hypothetical protein
MPPAGSGGPQKGSSITSMPHGGHAASPSPAGPALLAPPPEGLAGWTDPPFVPPSLPPPSRPMSAWDFEVPLNPAAVTLDTAEPPPPKAPGPTTRARATGKKPSGRPLGSGKKAVTASVEASLPSASAAPGHPGTRSKTRGALGAAPVDAGSPPQPTTVAATTVPALPPTDETQTEATPALTPEPTVSDGDADAADKDFST